MKVSKEVHQFTHSCEELLAAVAANRPLTNDEARIVEYYCKDMLIKAVPFQTTCEPLIPTTSSTAFGLHPVEVGSEQALEGMTKI